MPRQGHQARREWFFQGRRQRGHLAVNTGQHHGIDIARQGLFALLAEINASNVTPATAAADYAEIMKNFNALAK